MAFLLLAALLALTPFLTKAQSFEQTFVTDPNAKQTAHALADPNIGGKVRGTFQPITGSLTFDPEALDQGIRGQFEIEMAVIDTGNRQRDRHMRAMYLETEVYPKARFTVNNAVPSAHSKGNNGTMHFEVTGSLELHGVERELTVRAVLRPNDRGLEAEVEFDIAFTEYGMEPPKRFIFRVKDEVQVRVRLMLISDENT